MRAPLRARLAAVCLGGAIAASVPSSAAAQTAAAPPTMPWQAVERILTADTIDVRGVGVVRLAGIEAAGDLSRAFLAGLISSRAVQVVFTPHSTGLSEALVYTPDGRCVNAEMIRFGYARARTAPGFDRAAEFRGLEEDARRLTRGLWGAPAQEVAAPAPARPARDASRRRFYIGVGGGAVIEGVRDWAAAVEAGTAVSSALSLYLAAGHLHDLGDARTAGADRAWHGGGGLRLTLPLPLPVRPYAKGGGGYMRILPRGGASKRDEPFWEAGGGFVTAAGPVHLDVGYIFARVAGTDVVRVAGVLGVRF